MDKEELENAGIDYFAQLYGATSEEGEPQQTFFDKWRDKSIAKAYRKHSRVQLAESEVLDVGCGYGWLLDAFQGARTLSGLDIAHHAVEKATKRMPERFFKQANLQEPIPFTHSFDLILAINIIEHLTEPAAGIKSIANSTKPGGIVIIHLPTITNWFTKWFYSKTYEADPTHIYRPTGEEVRELFEQAGFKTLRDSYFPHFLPALTKIWPIHPAYFAVFRKTTNA
jgi:2-polyprenyl-3-methyl-5-hydroxy-6-metoxy-1,4-benzoquinol methylase